MVYTVEEMRKILLKRTQEMWDIWDEIEKNKAVKTVIILIGIPASGKSTFCNEYFPEFVRINLDTLKTRNKERLLIESCFADGKSFVVDNTNPTQ